MSKIEDFGEKIGGARKDLYALNRALRLSDVADWSDTDRESYITKKETFPLPDYKKLYESGVDRRVVWFIKKLRDALPTKPQKPYARDMNDEEKRQALRKAQEDYITTMSGIYDETMKLAVPYGTVYECISFYDRIKNLPDKSCLTGSRKIREIATLTSTYVRSHFFDEMDKKQFLYTDEEKILANYRIYRYDGTNVLKPGELSPGSERDDCLVISPSAGIRYYSYGNDPETADMSTWQTDTWFAMDRRSSGAVAAHSIQTEDELKNLLVAMEKERGTPTQEKQTKKRKVKYTPPQLAATRPVSRDYRSGHDITGEDMMNTFGFRAGEFGNWESDNDRLANLNMSYDAFKDLARVLDIDDRDISLGGNLAVAYGARGRKGAAAHFEPGSNVINLTKMNGAGSLAHEWGHALDYAAARSENLQGIFLTESGSPGRDLSGRFRELMNAIKYKPLKGREGYAGDLSDFYLNAKRLDATYTKQGHGYWSGDVELFARAFAAYIKDKLLPDASDYLCGHADGTAAVTDTQGRTEMVPVMPTGDERLRINAAFDGVIAKLRECGVLHARLREQREHDINSRPRRRQAEAPGEEKGKEKMSKETADRMTPPESEQTAKSPKKTETKKTGKSR